jgi:hypothetical protein
LVALDGGTASFGDDPAAIGVVVLRNGNVLAGGVRRSGDYYLVEQAGAALQIPVEQVETACSSLAEAYELRRQNRVGTSADAHLELARWCLRHNLLDQAAREALDARTRDPGHPALASLEVQIRQMLKIEASRRDRVEMGAIAGGSLPNILHDGEPSAGLALTPSTAAQSQFVRSIQPMLIHGCATGGCHQVDSPQQMRLDRWALDGNGNPELIRRNLDAILAQINPEDPASSPVMLRARQAHGVRNNAMSRPLATYQAALLLGWLNEAAGVVPTPPTESAELDAAEETESAQPQDDSRPITGKPIPVLPTSADFTPRDAFDPEIFNRRAAAQTAGVELPTGESTLTGDDAIPSSDDADAIEPSSTE